MKFDFLAKSSPQDLLFQTALLCWSGEDGDCRLAHAGQCGLYGTNASTYISVADLLLLCTFASYGSPALLRCTRDKPRLLLGLQTRNTGAGLPRDTRSHVSVFSLHTHRQHFVLSYPHPHDSHQHTLHVATCICRGFCIFYSNLNSFMTGRGTKADFLLNSGSVTCGDTLVTSSFYFLIYYLLHKHLLL